MGIMNKSAEPTYVVAKLDVASWTLCQQGKEEILYQGPFWNTWSYARELVSGLAHARLVALNEDGRRVAEELVRSRDTGAVAR
jgi:hypothetical protein